MATHNVGVCNNWNGSPGDQVNFTNPSATQTFTISSDPNSTWPFTTASPISVPPGGATTYLKSPLPNAVYYYEVDGCTDLSRKGVTVP